MAVAEKPKRPAAQEALVKVTEELRKAKAERRSLNARIARLERRQEALRRRRSGAPVPLDAHKQAGPKNVEMMRGVFREGRVLTAAEATRQAGSEPGHQVWAIRALVEERQIEPTGYQVGQSIEYRWVGRNRQRRLTKLGPGE